MSIQECRDTNILPPETKETGEQRYHNDNNTQCYSQSSDYHIPLSQTSITTSFVSCWWRNYIWSHCKQKY